MGYYVTTTDVNVTIPLTKAEAALNEMKRINGPEFDAKKGGGSWSNGRKVASFYSWMPEDFSGYTSLVDFLLDVGFQDTVVQGDHIELGYYDSKTGDEEFFLACLAPFITPGSYIDWCGEEGDMYRWEFDGETMTQLSGHVVWE